MLHYRSTDQPVLKTIYNERSPVIMFVPEKKQPCEQRPPAFKYNAPQFGLLGLSLKVSLSISIFNMSMKCYLGLLTLKPIPLRYRRNDR